MIIYRDENDEPTHIAYLSPSSFQQAVVWCRNNNFNISTHDLIGMDRDYVREMSRHIRSDVRYPVLWHLHEVSRMRGLTTDFQI